MRSVAVVVKCSSGELARVREALRLTAGLSIGGIDATVIFLSPALQLLAAALRSDPDVAEVAAQVATLREIGVRIRFDERQAGTENLTIEGDASVTPVTPEELDRCIGEADGTIVFGPQADPPA